MTMPMPMPSKAIKTTTSNDKASNAGNDDVAIFTVSFLKANCFDQFTSASPVAYLVHLQSELNVHSLQHLLAEVNLFNQRLQAIGLLRLLTRPAKRAAAMQIPAK